MRLEYGVGECKVTQLNCVSGSSRTCVPKTGTAELCNGKDDDCNGATDDGILPSGTCSAGIGGCLRQGQYVCQSGSTVCSATPGSPTAETCGDGIDNDCNGTTDDGCGPCVPNASQPCYTGPAGTQSIGRCHDGSRNCDSTGNWPSACPGQVVPAASETCNGVDDDCNGQTDESFACRVGSTTSCTSSCGTTGTSTCTSTCTPGACVPPAETCNGIDDDCDGIADDNTGCPDCVLVEFSFPGAPANEWFGTTAMCTGPYTWVETAAGNSPHDHKFMAKPGYQYHLALCDATNGYPCMVSESTPGLPIWTYGAKPTITFNGKVVPIYDFDANRKRVDTDTCALFHDETSCYLEQMQAPWYLQVGNLVCSVGAATEWDCTNGIDDDGDGATDCNDHPDCNEKIRLPNAPSDPQSYCNACPN